ncbi:MAG: ABC transporter permease [Beutenbergiaceae bacterium]
MKTADLIGSAVSNTFRSKARTTLTVLAIFVGAFTLTVTSALGAGISSFLTDTVGNLGSSNVLNAAKSGSDTDGPPVAQEAEEEGPQVYDADAEPAAAASDADVTASYMNQADLDAIAEVDGVLSVEPDRRLGIDYIQYDGGDPYVIGATQLIPGQEMQLAAGVTPEFDSAETEALIPTEFLEPLGYDDAEAAVDTTLTIGLTDGNGDAQIVEATVTGVSEGSLSIGSATGSLVVNETLAIDLLDLAQVGLSEDVKGLYTNAFVEFDEALTEDEVTALQDELVELGFQSSTLQQQLGVITAVIDGIVFVLNAFAIIALIAASFGIINTLYMSVAERTREIGLMKAMGMGSGRVFSLFTLEAAFIGLLGSAFGVVVAMAAATGLSGTLADSFLADLDGLELFLFEPATIAVIVAAIVGIAFLAGTLPAGRAARQDPVTSLRYE